MHKKLLFAILFAAIVLACAREEAGPVPESGLSFTVQLPEPVLTRTQLGGFEDGVYKTLWQAGDRISVNGLCSEPLAEGGATRGVFHLAGDVLSPYNILYPSTTSEETVVIPSVQHCIPGTFDPAAMPMWGTADALESLSLKHYCSVLRFSVAGAGEFTLKRVLVNALGGEALSGSFRAGTLPDGHFDGTLVPQDAGASVSLDFGDDGLPLADTPRTFHICIPGGTYSRGLNALLVSTDDRAMELVFNSTEGHHDIPASRVVEFPQVSFTATSSQFIIDSAEDLLAYAADISSFPAAQIIGDIDMTGRDWTPIPQISGSLFASGSIRGLGAPFCDLLTGRIEGLRVHSDLNVTDGSRSALIACRVKGPSAALVNCRAEGSIIYNNPAATGVQVGGVAAECEGGATFTRNSFTGTITIGAGTVVSGALNVGGVVASLSSSASELTSTADITVDNSVQADTLRVGGVAGRHSGAEALGAAAFSGTLSVTRSHIPVLFAGVALGEEGAPSLGAGITIEDNASLQVTLSSVQGTVALGGIAGYCSAGSSTLTGIASNGLVMLNFDDPQDAYTASDRILVGGICGLSGPVQMNGCTNGARITVNGATAAATGVMPSSRMSVGGILGGTICADGAALTLDHCTNNGPITFNNTDGLRAWAAGIAARPQAASVTISNCTNSAAIVCNGYSSGLAMGGIAACLWQGEDAESVLQDCTNSGRLALYDGDKLSSGQSAAGGIVGTVAALESHPAVLTVSGCLNTADIDRRVNSGTTFANAAAYAGGIVGAIGYNHSTSHTYSAITALVSDCGNSGRIIFNAYIDDYTFIENRVDQSFTGGIAGMIDCYKGKATVKCCENSGNLYSTSGQHGGIVGMVYANATICGEKTAEGVRYTVNRGNVGELNADADLKDYQASGYLITGGIAGYLSDPGDAEGVDNLIEYCYNQGGIAGSSSKSNATFLGYCTGGLVGQYKKGTVRYCKSFGSVRNYKCSFNTTATAYSGLLSGCQPSYNSERGKFLDCAAGGKIWRGSWVTPDEGTEKGVTKAPYINYLYASYGSMAGNASMEKYWKDNNIVFWNGASKLDWE